MGDKRPYIGQLSAHAEPSIHSTAIMSNIKALEAIERLGKLFMSTKISFQYVCRLDL